MLFSKRATERKCLNTMGKSKQITYLRVYHEFERQTKSLSDEQIGKLLRAMLAYSARKEITSFDDDAFLNMAFEYEKAKIDAAHESFEEISAQRSSCGKLGGRPRKIQDSPQNDVEAESPDFES